MNAYSIFLDNYIHTHNHVYILSIHSIKVYTHLLTHNDKSELTVEHNITLKRRFSKETNHGFYFQS